VPLRESAADLVHPVVLRGEPDVPEYAIHWTSYLLHHPSVPEIGWSGLEPHETLERTQWIEDAHECRMDTYCLARESPVLYASCPERTQEGYVLPLYNKEIFERKDLYAMGSGQERKDPSIFYPINYKCVLATTLYPI